MITKRVVTSSVEFTEDNIIFVKEDIIIEEDGVELIRYRGSRRSLSPTSDISKEDQRVKTVAASFFTDDVKKAYEKKLEDATKRLLESLNVAIPVDEIPVDGPIPTDVEPVIKEK